MELPLYEGSFEAYSCGSRTGLFFLTTVLVLGVLVTCSLWITGMLARRNKALIPTPRGNGRFSIGLETSAAPRESSWKLLPASVVIILMIALLAPLSYSQSRVVATDTSIIRTGCHFLGSYTDVFARATADFVYHYSYGKYHVRSDSLEIRQKGNRPIIIDLDQTPYLRNLEMVAPVAVRKYFDQKRADGEQVPIGFGS